MRQATIGAAILALVLLAAAAQAQTNPCTSAAPSGVVLNPANIAAALPEHTTLEADGITQRVTQYQAAYFKQGDNPATATPVQGPSTMPKTAWTETAPGSGCYTSTLPAAVPTGQVLVGAIKSQRAATATVPAAESPWSPVTNPFAAAPSALQAPGQTRMIR